MLASSDRDTHSSDRDTHIGKLAPSDRDNHVKGGWLSFGMPFPDRASRRLQVLMRGVLTTLARSKKGRTK